MSNRPVIYRTVAYLAQMYKTFFKEKDFPTFGDLEKCTSCKNLTLNSVVISKLLNNIVK